MDKLDKNEYRTISKTGEGQYKEKGSKFIGYCFFAATEEQVKTHIEFLKKEHHSARHFCYGYRINPREVYERANDDGEPRHSAGTPILGQLQSYDVVNCLVVVVRYFGGTKLGVSGLISAYKESAKDCIQQANIISSVITDEFELFFNYSNYNEVFSLHERSLQML